MGHRVDVPKKLHMKPFASKGAYIRQLDIRITELVVCEQISKFEKLRSLDER